MHVNYVEAQMSSRCCGLELAIQTGQVQGALCLLTLPVVLRFAPTSSLCPSFAILFLEASPFALVSSLATFLRLPRFRRLFSVLEFDSAPPKVMLLTVRTQW
ncbi:hypothetical protein TNCV_4306471 [Trichonephila clavipes]|nr:hypothetical protein TNCV_4306471 [Trichonephila clavipes]